MRAWPGLLMLVWLCSAPASAHADRPTEVVAMGAHVVKVDLAKGRATLDRGKRAGLKVGDKFPVLPVRAIDGSSEKIDGDAPVAKGRVVELADDTAVVALEEVGGTVEVGAHYGYELRVPAELAESALFRATAAGIVFLPHVGETPYVTVEAMLADPSPARLVQVLDAMLADIRPRKPAFSGTGSSRIDKGRYQGQDVLAVIAALSRAELLDLCLYTESMRRFYATKPMRLPQHYLSWVYAGAPSGELFRKGQIVAPIVTAANTAASAGKLDAARAHWASVLKGFPEHPDARAKIEELDRAQAWARQVVADADDTATRAKLVNLLQGLGAYELGLQHNAVLLKQAYQPFVTERRTGYLLAEQKRWHEAEAVLKRLLKDHPGDKNLTEWLAHVRAHARVAASPEDPAAHLELAAVLVSQKRWSRATEEYATVIASKRTTAKQRELATAARARLVNERDVDQYARWAKAALREHDLETARKHIASMLKLLDQLGDAARTSEVLLDVANEGHFVEEDEVWLEVLRMRADRSKNDGATNIALGLALYELDRLDEAAAAGAKAMKVKGHEAGGAWVVALVAQTRGDLGEVERLTTKAQVSVPRAAWPKVLLAKVEAGRDNWQEAIDLARKALAINDTASGSARATLNASLRGLQAHEALQADATSPRERLRLVRALADLGLVRRATDEIAKLSAQGSWRSEGWWSIAVSKDLNLAHRDRLAAAKNASPTSPDRKELLARLDATTRLRANPKDDATRIALAKLHLHDDNQHAALATLGPLMIEPLSPAVSDLVSDARRWNEMQKYPQLALAAAERGDFDGAMKRLLELQTLIDRSGGTQWRNVVRSLRTTVLSKQGRYNEAIALAEEAAKIANAYGAPELMGYANDTVARLRGAIGTNDALRVALTTNLKGCEERDDEWCMQGAHGELASLNLDDGRLAEATEHARKSWTLGDRLGIAEKGRLAQALLVSTKMSAGRVADAEQSALALLKECRSVGDVTNEESMLLTLGAIELRRGNGSAAHARFQEVYELGTRTGSTFIRAIARQMEGEAWLFAERDFKQAAKALEQAAALLEPSGEEWSVRTRMGALHSLARARMKDNRLAEARAAAEQSYAIALRFQRRVSVAQSHVLLGQIALAEQKSDDALAQGMAALALAEKTDKAELLAGTWYLLARSYTMKQQDQQAFDGFEKALAQVDRALLAAGGESDRGSYLKGYEVRAMYADAVDHFLKLGKTDRAMHVLEQSRETQLKQTFDAGSIQSTDPKQRARLALYEEERARAKALQKQLEEAANKPGAQRSQSQVTALGELLAKSRQNLESTAAVLRGEDKILGRVMSVDPQRLVDRRQQLPAGAVLVQYFAAGDALHAFVITPAAAKPVVIKTKVKRAELAKTVADFRAALTAESGKVKEREAVENLGRQLEDWLLQPLRKYLDGASTVIIVPFGPLYYVPFDALVVSEPGKPVRYAVEDHRISVQTALTIERLLEPARPRTTGTMLAISNPDGSLPGAQREVAAIVKTLPDARVLSRKAATVKQFVDLAGGFRYLHVASHGILDPDPWKSYLKLADAQLSVADITRLAGLRTSNEMVVLSACESATAQGGGTDEDLMSLAGGFALAGAPSIVASLWEVSDASTAELMSTFYRALDSASSKGDRLDALRNAKLNLLRFKQGKGKPYAEPWHWASFELFGDFRAPASPN